MIKRIAATFLLTLLAISLSAQFFTGFVFANRWIQQFATGQNNSHGMVYLNGFIYNILETTPAQVTKMSVSNPSSFTTMSFAADGLHDDGIVIILVVAQAKLYATFQSDTQLQISQVDPVAMTYTDVFFRAGAFGRGSMTTDGNYLFTADRANSANKFIAVSLTDYSSSIISQPYLGGTHCIKYDTVSGKLYATNWQANGAITRISPLPPFVAGNIEDTEAILDSGFHSYGFFTHEMTFFGNYVYLGSEYNSSFVANPIIRVQKNSLSTAVDVIDASLTSPIWNIASDTNYIYATDAAAPAHVVVVNPADLSFKKGTFRTGLNECNDMVFNGNNAYAVFNVNPDIVASVTMAGPHGHAKASGHNNFK